MSPKKSRILHVEDDPSLRNLVGIALERLGGYAVRSAADGFEAVVMAREFLPDLLLLDLDLPGRDGIETLASLRNEDGLRDAPVVFLTAAGDAKVRSQLLALGVCAVLGKPFQPRELVRVIGLALAGEPA